MTRCTLIPAALVMLLASCGLAPAADPRHPDWPCVQAKVPEISLAAVWSGPPIDDVGRRWEDDPKIKELVARVAPRRTQLEDAQKEIADFLAGDSAAKLERARLLFGGLFEVLNRERADVMSGIERLARRQKQFIEKIQSDTAKLREMQDAADRDAARFEELSSQIEWSTRILEDRRRTVRYVCEVPVMIERRLFAFGRAIQQALD